MYHAIGSPGSRLTRVLWMLEELREPYEIVKSKIRSDTMRRYNPSGKSPALADGNVVVTDSAAICAYLADKHAEKGMGAAPGPAGRAEMDSWMHFAQSEFEAPLWNKLRHKFLLPEEMRADVGKATAHDFASEVKTLHRRLGDKPYALGERFSAVDVVLAIAANGRAARSSRSLQTRSMPISIVCSRARRWPGRRSGKLRHDVAGGSRGGVGDVSEPFARSAAPNLA